MSYKFQKIESKNLFPKIKFLYITFFLFYVLYFALLILTNGKIEQILKENYTLIFIPLVIPFFMSFLGVYHFTFTDRNGLVEIKSECMVLGKFLDSYKVQLIIPVKSISGYKLKTSLFGFKKSINIKFMGSNRKYKKNFNISLLSNSETNILMNYLLKKI